MRRRPRVSAVWTSRHLERIVETPSTTRPVIPWPVPRALPELDVWDLWPIQEAAGSLCTIAPHPATRARRRCDLDRRARVRRGLGGLSVRGALQALLGAGPVLV